MLLLGPGKGEIRAGLTQSLRHMLVGDSIIIVIKKSNFTSALPSMGLGRPSRLAPRMSNPHGASISIEVGPMRRGLIAMTAGS